MYLKSGHLTLISHPSSLTSSSAHACNSQSCSSFSGVSKQDNENTASIRNKTTNKKEKVSHQLQVLREPSSEFTKKPIA